MSGADSTTEMTPTGRYEDPSLSIAVIVTVAKPAPKGRLRKAQGASPGNKYGNDGSPEGAKQPVPVLKKSAYDEHLSEVETEVPAPPLQGSLQSGP